ncbi:unnamed protein product [Gordionus sp. m RMFG-2023]
MRRSELAGENTAGQREEPYGSLEEQVESRMEEQRVASVQTTRDRRSDVGEEESAKGREVNGEQEQLALEQMRGAVVETVQDPDEAMAWEELMRLGEIGYSIEDLMIKQVCEGIALADEEECEDEEASETRYKTSDFSTQIPLPPKDYLWRDKYKPRKPRFFNRVHTGFEWNKYNQTHYDFDNPPPKIVQGYKFNIFYPDLIDKGVTPKYSVNPCYEEGQDKRSAPTPDFAVLRFSAGPPYEDIAFKIVNREWECSYKRDIGIDDNREINPRCLAEL